MLCGRVEVWGDDHGRIPLVLLPQRGHHVRDVGCSPSPLAADFVAAGDKSSAFLHQWIFIKLILHFSGGFGLVYFSSNLEKPQGSTKRNPKNLRLSQIKRM